MRSRVQNSINNIMCGAVNRFVSIAFPFFSRTIFIRFLGEEYLGLNSLFYSVLQVLNLADLGFASAIVASMYKPIATNDVNIICALMNLYRKIYKIIGSIILTVGVVITPFISYLIRGNPPSDVNIYILWVLYLMDLVICYLLFPHKISLINAHQRSDVTENIGSVCRIIISIVQIFVIIAFKSLYLYSILTCVYSVIFHIWCSIECDKRYPQYKCQGELNNETKNAISKNIAAMAIQRIGDTVSVSLDAMVISAFLGLTTVAIYSNYYYVVLAIASFIKLIYSSITSSIGNSIVTEPVDKNAKDFNKLFFLNTWLIGWCCVCFICLFQDFMTVWMGNDLLFDIDIVILLVLRFYLEQIRQIVLTYKDAAGLWWADKLRPLVGCIVNLTLNLILVKKTGVAGVMLSTIVSYVFVEIPWETNALYKEYFNRSPAKYYGNFVKLTLSILIATVVTYRICTMINLGNVLNILIKLGVCIVVPNIVFVILNCKNRDFYSAVDWVQKVIIQYNTNL